MAVEPHPGIVWNNPDAPDGFLALDWPLDSLAMICSQVEAGTPVLLAISWAALEPVEPGVLPLPNLVVEVAWDADLFEVAPLFTLLDWLLVVGAETVLTW